MKHIYKATKQYLSVLKPQNKLALQYYQNLLKNAYNEFKSNYMDEEQFKKYIYFILEESSRLR